MATFVRVFSAEVLESNNDLNGPLAHFTANPYPSSATPSMTPRLIDLEKCTRWSFTEKFGGWTDADAFVDITVENRENWSAALDFETYWSRIH